MCIAYRSKANMDEVMCMKYETKEITKDGEVVC